MQHYLQNQNQNAYIPSSVYQNNNQNSSSSMMNHMQQNQMGTMSGTNNYGIHNNAYIPASVYPPSQTSDSLRNTSFGSQMMQNNQSYGQNTFGGNTMMNTSGMHTNAYIPASVYPPSQTSDSLRNTNFGSNMMQNNTQNQMNPSMMGQTNNYGMHSNAYIPASVYPPSQASESLRNTNFGSNMMQMQNNTQNQMNPSSMMGQTNNYGMHSNAYIPASVYPPSQTSDSLRNTSFGSNMMQNTMQNNNQNQMNNSFSSMNTNAYIPASTYMSANNQLRNNQNQNYSF